MKIEKIIWRYYAFQFLASFSLFSAVLVPFFTNWGGITLAKTQLLQSWFMFFVFVMEVPTGAVADYLGRKYSLIAGAIVFALGTLVYGSVPKYEIFLLGELILAIGVALQSGAGEALLYDNLKSNGLEKMSKQIFGRAHTARLLGMMISAPIGGLIAGKWGLNYPMLLTAIPNTLAAAVAMKIPEPKIETIQSEATRYVEVVKKGLKYLTKNRILWRLSLNSIVVASVAYYIIWWYQPLLINAGVQVGKLGWFHVILLMSEVVVSSQFRRLEQWAGSETKYLRITAALTGLSLILAAVWPGIISGTILLIIGGGFGLTRLEYMGAIINRHVESAQRATVLSSISMFRRLALVPLNPVFGMLADRSLSTAMLIVSTLPLALVFLPMYRSYRSIKKD
ncbi:MAG: MFS transporter [bacterium]